MACGLPRESHELEARTEHHDGGEPELQPAAQRPAEVRDPPVRHGHDEQRDGEGCSKDQVPLAASLLLGVGIFARRCLRTAVSMRRTQAPQCIPSTSMSSWVATALTPVS